MKNKNTLLAIILVFVLLLGGAYALYDRLGQAVTAEQMIVHATPQPTAEPATEEVLPESEPAAETESSDHEEPEYVLAPDFNVYDKDGNTVHLSVFFGKPIVLNFWASWCGPCQSEMPDFNEKYAELGDDIHFVMVNMTDGGRETVETASAFIERQATASLFSTTPVGKLQRPTVHTLCPRPSISMQKVMSSRWLWAQSMPLLFSRASI